MIEFCPHHEPHIGTGPIPIPTMATCLNPYCRIRTWLAVSSVYGALDRQHQAHKVITLRSDDPLSPLVARLSYRTIAL